MSGKRPIPVGPPASGRPGRPDTKSNLRNFRSIELKNGRRIETYEETYFHKSSFVIRGVNISGRAGIVAFPPEALEWLQESLTVASGGTIAPKPAEGGEVVFRRPPQNGRVSP